MKDEKLDQLLKNWEIEVPEDSSFRSSVWREVAIRESTSQANRIRDALDKLLSPKFAIPVATAAVLAVMLVASFHGQQSQNRTWNDLADAYNSAIDPVAHSQLLATTDGP